MWRSVRRRKARQPSVDLFLQQKVKQDVLQLDLLQQKVKLKVKQVDLLQLKVSRRGVVR